MNPNTKSQKEIFSLPYTVTLSHLVKADDTWEAYTNATPKDLETKKFIPVYLAEGIDEHGIYCYDNSDVTLVPVSRILEYDINPGSVDVIQQFIPEENIYELD